MEQEGRKASLSTGVTSEGRKPRSGRKDQDCVQSMYCSKTIKSDVDRMGIRGSESFRVAAKPIDESMSNTVERRRQDVTRTRKVGSIECEINY